MNPCNGLGIRRAGEGRPAMDRPSRRIFMIGTTQASSFSRLAISCSISSTSPLIPSEATIRRGYRAGWLLPATSAHPRPAQPAPPYRLHQTPFAPPPSRRDSGAIACRRVQTRHAGSPALRPGPIARFSRPAAPQAGRCRTRCNRTGSVRYVHIYFDSDGTIGLCGATEEAQQQVRDMLGKCRELLESIRKLRRGEWP
jgi:hypothetical protein